MSTLAALRTKLRTYALMRGVPEMFLSDPVFLDLFNDWQLDFNRETQMLRNDNQASPTHSVANQEAYTLPTDFLGPLPLDVSYENAHCEVVEPKTYFRIKRARAESTETESIDSDQIYVTAYEGDLLLSPAPDTANEDLVLWYARTPAVAATVTGSAEFAAAWDHAFLSFALWKLLEGTWRQQPSEAQQKASRQEALKMEADYQGWVTKGRAFQAGGRKLRVSPMRM